MGQDRQGGEVGGPLQTTRARPRTATCLLPLRRPQLPARREGSGRPVSLRPGAQEMGRLRLVSYLEGSDSAQEPPGNIFSPRRLVPGQSGWSWGETQQLDRRGRRHLRRVAVRPPNPPAGPPHSAGSRDRDYIPARGARAAPDPEGPPALVPPEPGRGRTAGPPHAPVPRVTVSGRPRAVPGRAGLAAPRASPGRRPARGGDARKAAARPPAPRRPGSARRSRAPAGPGPPAHFAARVPPPRALAASGRPQSSVRGGDGRAAPTPRGPARLRELARRLPRAPRRGPGTQRAAAARAGPGRAAAPRARGA